jgi:transposase InsO family protein
VILDLYSRRVVGWKLGQTLEAELVVTALRNALVLRRPDLNLPERFAQKPLGSSLGKSGEI